MTTQAIKVSRVKLIERLKVALAAEKERYKARRDQDKASRVKHLKDYIASYQAELEQIKAGEPGYEYGEGYTDAQLMKTIRLLEMSEEETITVRASSDVYRYL